MVRAKLTYANVMATIAVFIALGGSAVALTQITGKDIRNHSIGSEEFKRTATAPRALVAARAAQLLVSGSDTHRSKRAGLAAVEGEDNVVKLSVGETATVLEKDPFSFTATCEDAGGGAVRFQLFANSSESGSIVSDNVGDDTAPLEPGQPIEVFNAPMGVTGPRYLAGVGRIALVAPSGRSLDIGAVNAGYHLFGADCSVTMFGIS